MAGYKKLLLGTAVIAAIVLIALQKWEWLLFGALLACPLMHLFMHGGHGGHGSHQGHGAQKEEGQRTPQDSGSHSHSGSRHGDKSCH